MLMLGFVTLLQTRTMYSNAQDCGATFFQPAPSEPPRDTQAW